MNWETWMPVFIYVITAIFVFGKTFGRISDQEKTLKRHDDQLDVHEGKIESLERLSEYGRGLREGFDAGKAAAARAHG
jgi:hypothetical protein